MKNLEEYIDKAKSLENSRPLLSIEELSTLIDAREAAPAAGTAASPFIWRKFLLPSLSAALVVLAVFISTRKINDAGDASGSSSLYSKKVQTPTAAFNALSETIDTGNANKIRSNGVGNKTKNIIAAKKPVLLGYEERSKNVPQSVEKENASGIARTETPAAEAPSGPSFDLDGFREEQRNLLDSLLAARFARMDSLLAAQPRESHRVDTVVIREIIMKNPSNIDFTHSLSINFWLMKDNIYEIQYEFAPIERWSFTLKGGFGSLLGRDKVFKTATGIEEKSPYKLFIIGSKIAYYLFGDFKTGEQVGLDATYYATSYNVARAAGPYGEGRGFNVTPFVGYKLILSPGYTLNVQAGYGMKYCNVFEGYRDGNGVYQGYIRSVFKSAYTFNVNFGWSM